MLNRLIVDVKESVAMSVENELLNRDVQETFTWIYKREVKILPIFVTGS